MLPRQAQGRALWHDERMVTLVRIALRLIEDAPLAAIRRAITNPDANKPGQPAANLPPSAVFAGRSAGSSRRLSRL